MTPDYKEGPYGLQVSLDSGRWPKEGGGVGRVRDGLFKSRMGHHYVISDAKWSKNCRELINRFCFIKSIFLRVKDNWLRADKSTG